MSTENMTTEDPDLNDIDPDAFPASPPPHPPAAPAAPRPHAVPGPCTECGETARDCFTTLPWSRRRCDGCV